MLKPAGTIALLSVATVLACGDGPTAPPASSPDGPARFGLFDVGKSLDVASDLGIRWQRHHVLWEHIQPRRGAAFDWTQLDGLIRRMQEQRFEILLTLMPMAQWDQRTCRSLDEPYGEPCDLEAWAGWVTAIVERYDGDGVDDMPGLATGISHWETYNEPDLPDRGYQLTPRQYLDLLEATYPAVRTACPKCRVLQGGVPNMTAGEELFLGQYLDMGGADFFDVANIHFIQESSFQDDFWLRRFVDFLGAHQALRPVWVTEVQIESGPGAAFPCFSDSQAAAEMVKAYVRAFALGAEVIFYTIVRHDPMLPDNLNRAALIDSQGRRRPAYTALKTMIAQTDGFIAVETIATDGASGLYRFRVGGRDRYVAWGSGVANLPVSGTVRVVAVDGTGRDVDARDLQRTDAPVFVRQLDDTSRP